MLQIMAEMQPAGLRSAEEVKGQHHSADLSQHFWAGEPGGRRGNDMLVVWDGPHS